MMRCGGSRSRSACSRPRSTGRSRSARWRGWRQPARRRKCRWSMQREIRQDSRGRSDARRRAPGRARRCGRPLPRRAVSRRGARGGPAASTCRHSAHAFSASDCHPVGVIPEFAEGKYPGPRTNVKSARTLGPGYFASRNSGMTVRRILLTRALSGVGSRGFAIGQGGIKGPNEASHGLFCRQREPHLALPDHRHVDQGARAESQGPRHHLAVRGRARFRHARQHQGRRDQGAARGQDQVHRRRRHPRAEGRHRRQVQARERPRLQAVARSRSAPAASRCSTTRCCARSTPATRW